MAKFGDPIDQKKMTAGQPPLVFQIQPNGYIKLESAKDIADWENRLKQFYGLSRKNLGDVVPLDTCSGGCLDDCGAAY